MDSGMRCEEGWQVWDGEGGVPVDRPRGALQSASTVDHTRISGSGPRGAPSTTVASHLDAVIPSSAPSSPPPAPLDCIATWNSAILHKGAGRGEGCRSKRQLYQCICNRHCPIHCSILDRLSDATVPLCRHAVYPVDSHGSTGGGFRKPTHVFTVPEPVMAPPLLVSMVGWKWPDDEGTHAVVRDGGSG